MKNQNLNSLKKLVENKKWFKRLQLENNIQLLTHEVAQFVELEYDNIYHMRQDIMLLIRLLEKLLTQVVDTNADEDDNK